MPLKKFKCQDEPNKCWLDVAKFNHTKISVIRIMHKDVRGMVICLDEKQIKKLIEELQSL